MRAHLRALNAGAEVIEAASGDIAAGRLFDRQLFQPAARIEQLDHWLAAVHEQHDHSAHFSAHVLRHAGSLSLAGTSVFLNRIVNEFKDQVLRIKGIAGFREKGGRPAVLHAVQNKFYPVAWLEQWPDDDHSSRLVIIGRELDTRRIDELFVALCV